jgi:hypothetical protein
MGRMITLVAALAVTVAACSAGSGPATPPAVTPAPTTAAVAPTESPTQPPATPEPSASAVEIPVAVVWDGKDCTYTGPTDIPRGARMTFTMTNTPKAMDGSVGAALLFMHVDDGITASDFDAWMAKHPRGSDIPPWVDQMELIGPLYPEGAAAGDTMSHVMTSNEYIVVCGRSPNEGESMHLATILTIKDR